MGPMGPRPPGAHGPRPLGPIGPIRSHAVAWPGPVPDPRNCMPAHGPYGPRGLGPWALWAPGALGPTPIFKIF